MMEVQINETEQFGPIAEVAKKRYNIEPKRVTTDVRGAYTQQNLPGRGVHLRAGEGRAAVHRPRHARRVRVGPLDLHGEQQKRKRIGVVETDAPLMGRFSMQGPSPSWQIITELKKQYEVVQVNPTQPIPPASRPPSRAKRTKASTCSWPCSPRPWARRKSTT